jgi:hypothetical protein
MLNRCFYITRLVTKTTRDKSGGDQIYVSGGGRVAHALCVWVCSLGDALMVPKTGLCAIVDK